MIAAVTGENVLNLMSQPGQAGNGAAGEGDAFNTLLNMLMNIEPQAIAPVSAEETPAEVIDFAIPESSEGAVEQEQPEGGQNPVTHQPAQVSQLMQAFAQWMQPQADHADLPETAATMAETKPSENASPVAQAAAQTAIKPLPGPIVAVLARLANIQHIASKIDNQTVAPAETESKAAANVDAKVIEAATDPKIASVARKPNPIIEKLQNRIEAATARLSDGSEQKEFVTQAGPVLIQMVANLKAAVEAGSVKPEAGAEKPSAKPAEKKNAEIEPIWNVVAMSAPVAAIAEQPIVAATTTTVMPEPARQTKTTTTINKPVLPTQPEAGSVVNMEAAAQQAPPANAEPIAWNLTELVHRFDETLKQVMAEQPTVDAPKTETVAGALRNATQPAPAAKLTTVTEAKPAMKIDETVTIAAAQPHIATWQAEPVMDQSETARVPALNEQIRIASEWLAERAEGTIRVGDKGTEAIMRLYPPDMGQVRVSLNVGHDLSVQAQFVAERPETAQALRQNLTQLQDAFTRQGLTLDKIQVTVAQASSPNPGGSQGQQSFANMRRESQTAAHQERRQNERGQQDKQQR